MSKFLTFIFKGGRAGHKIEAVGGKLYVMGGWRKFKFLDEVEEYDPLLDKWTIKGCKTFQPWIFRPQSLTRNFSTPKTLNSLTMNFSPWTFHHELFTMNLSTMNLWTMNFSTINSSTTDFSNINISSMKFSTLKFSIMKFDKRAEKFIVEKFGVEKSVVEISYIQFKRGIFNPKLFKGFPFQPWIFNNLVE